MISVRSPSGLAKRSSCSPIRLCRTENTNAPQDSTGHARDETGTFDLIRRVTSPGQNCYSVATTNVESANQFNAVPYGACGPPEAKQAFDAEARRDPQSKIRKTFITTKDTKNTKKAKGLVFTSILYFVVERFEVFLSRPCAAALI